jgi:hypothetical protein
MTDKAFDVLMLNADAVKRGVLPMWTIYDRPKDHPDGFIARRFESIMPTADTLTGELEELREIFINAGLFKLPRSEGDEPQIVETWI